MVLFGVGLEGAGEQRKAQKLQALWMCVSAGHGAGMSTAVWG